MKEKLKDLLFLGMIIVGAILFDRTEFKLTGVIIIILSYVLDDEEWEE